MRKMSGKQEETLWRKSKVQNRFAKLRSKYRLCLSLAESIWGHFFLGCVKRIEYAEQDLTTMNGTNGWMREHGHVRVYLFRFRPCKEETSNRHWRLRSGSIFLSIPFTSLQPKFGDKFMDSIIWQESWNEQHQEVIYIAFDETWLW